MDGADFSSSLPSSSDIPFVSAEDIAGLISSSAYFTVAVAGSMLNVVLVVESTHAWCSAYISDF